MVELSFTKAEISVLFDQGKATVDISTTNPNPKIRSPCWAYIGKIQLLDGSYCKDVVACVGCKQVYVWRWSQRAVPSRSVKSHTCSYSELILKRIRRNITERNQQKKKQVRPKYAQLTRTNSKPKNRLPKSTGLLRKSPSNTLTLNWTEHTNTVCHMMLKSFTGTNSTDCVLVTNEGHRIKCHKLLLSCFSTFFEIIVDDHNRTHPRPPKPELVIPVGDIELWVLQALVKFMYDGEFVESGSRALAIFRAAEKLEIKGLSGVENFVRKMVRVKRSENFPAGSSTSTSTDYINQEQVTEKEPFLRFKPTSPCMEPIVIDMAKESAITFPETAKKFIKERKERKPRIIDMSEEFAKRFSSPIRHYPKPRIVTDQQSSTYASAAPKSSTSRFDLYTGTDSALFPNFKRSNRLEQQMLEPLEQMQNKTDSKHPLFNITSLAWGDPSSVFFDDRIKNIKPFEVLTFDPSPPPATVINEIVKVTPICSIECPRTPGRTSNESESEPESEDSIAVSSSHSSSSFSSSSSSSENDF